MRDGRLLLANQTLLANNRGTRSGANLLATGGEALYQLPAPPGRWIAGVRCIVYRDACPLNDRTCSGSREACSETPNRTSDGCRDATFLQPCNWEATPELIGQTIQVLPMGGDGIDDDFPFPCATGVRGSADPAHQSAPQCAGPCPAGKYQPALAGVECLACRQGSYCPLGSATPTPCPAGRFANHANCTGVAEAADSRRGAASSGGAVAHAGRCGARG